MAGQKTKGILLDLDQKIEGNQSIIQLIVKTKKGIEVFEDREFRPYFYVILEGEKYAQELSKLHFGDAGFSIT